MFIEAFISMFSFHIIVHRNDHLFIHMNFHIYIDNHENLHLNVHIDVYCKVHMHICLIDTYLHKNIDICIGMIIE